MEGRKWEDLELDCLLNVLRRVGIESLLLDVPFVCKSWYKAALHPSCWESLMFPQGQSYDRFTGRFMDAYKLNSLPVTTFIKFVIDRARRQATRLNLPADSSAEELKYAAEECPALTVLGLHSDMLYEHSILIPEVIGKWKSLEVLKLGSSYKLTEILPEVGLNCKNFAALIIPRSVIGEEEALSIVANLPKIKYLSLKRARLRRHELVKILQGCKDLVVLDVSDCIGYEADEEIMKLASHIKKFKHHGSKLEEDYEEDFGSDPASFYHYDDYCSD